MAKTAQGIIPEGEAYDKIVYVSKDRLQELKEKLSDKAKAEAITKEEALGLLFPDDMEDDSILVPVDISGEGDDFPTMPEEIVEKVGPKGAIEKMVKAAEHFEKVTSSKFSDDERPIPMSIGDWLSILGMQAGAEENGEEEALEDDKVVEPSPKKKAKRS
eukprot:TRINITY_DN93276_c0_g1_i1.p1 TRINITY_DN93276_c0_g1~~TRINITY_DN93276_c0_g1_i1.p1  ORF type:complete len:160 (+),score=49.32 TRINITY_DN93276_c0_g1_i1:84-563(+)